MTMPHRPRDYGVAPHATRIDPIDARQGNRKLGNFRVLSVSLLALFVIGAVLLFAFSRATPPSTPVTGVPPAPLSDRPVLAPITPLPKAVTPQAPAPEATTPAPQSTQPPAAPNRP